METETRTRQIRTEQADPWYGKEMRLPIGIMANFTLNNDPKSVFVKGWLKFASEAARKTQQMTSAA